MPIMNDKLADFELDGLLSDINVYLNVGRLFPLPADKCCIMLTQILRYHCGGGIMPDDLIRSISHCFIDMPLANNKYRRTGHIPTVSPVKNMLITLLNHGFKFDASFAMHFMNISREMVDCVMQTYDNKIDMKFLVQVIDCAKTFFCKYNFYEDMFRHLVVDKKIKVSLSQKDKYDYINYPHADVDFKITSPFIIHLILDDPEFVITEECTKSIAKNHDLSLLKKALSNGGVLTTEVLEYVCTAITTESDIYEKIMFILDNKIIPTQKAFNNIIESEKNNSNISSKKIAEKIVNMFTDYSYVVTYDDLKLALNERIVINNIERFNIKLDQTYAEICSQNGFYPYKTYDVTINYSELVSGCRKPGNLIRIKEIIEKHNLVPDILCMQEACKHKNNFPTIKYLISKGGHIDYNCLELAVYALFNRSLNYVFKEYGKCLAVDRPLDVVENQKNDSNHNEETKLDD